MKYRIEIQYNSALHLALLLKSGIACKGTTDTLAFIFDTLTDDQSKTIIDHLKN